MVKHTFTRSKYPIYAKERNKHGDERIITYIQDRLNELKEKANSRKKNNRNPSVFFDAAAFLDFLSTHIKNGVNADGTAYIDFIQKYIYNNVDIIFKARNDTYKLTEQIWHILRCGGLHNYSLSPYGWYNKNPALKNSLFLTNKHDKNKNITHKMIVNVDFSDGSLTSKGIVLVAEDFIEDVEKCVNKLLSNFRSKKPEYKKLKTDLRQSFKDCPPVGWYGWSFK